jgi:hypothetical protein
MRKIMKKIGGVLILALMIYVIYPIVVGDGNMESFCSGIDVGETKDEAVKRAIESGYEVRQSAEEQLLLIVDANAMGRFICEVSISANRVTNTRYVLND